MTSSADMNKPPSLPDRVVAERTHLQIPSLPDWIEPTVDYQCRRAALNGSCHKGRSGKLMVALHEAITNAVVHGNLEIDSALKEQGPGVFAETLARRSADEAYSSRLVDILVELNGDACHWVITDEGRGFDVERVLKRCLSDDPEITLASGRGILMMKTFLDDVRYEFGGRRLIMTMTREAGAEKRRDPRLVLTSPLRVTPLLPGGRPNWDASYDVLSRNLSEGGMAILQQQLSHAQQILIGIPTERGIINIPAEVKHSRPFGAGGVELGCHFLQVADRTAPQPVGAVEDLDGAIASILKDCENKIVPAHERREHQRVVFNERVAILIEDRPDAVIGYGRDLSKGGMALIAQEPLAADVTVVFHPTATRPELRVRSAIRRCDRIQEGFYDVGIAFVTLHGPSQGDGT